MPGMTGDELARQLRVNRARPQGALLTGYSDRLFKEKVALWADEAFLEKPFTHRTVCVEALAAHVRAPGDQHLSPRRSRQPHPPAPKP